MASSSSSTPTWKYDVFPSFSGEDVRKSFLSHLLHAFKRRAIISFIDNGIERSHLIADELLLAIRQSRISIVIFSKRYVSSTWCLNELAEIHDCHEESDQMVIPMFYEVDPSHVRKQTGEFGKAFDMTCKGKTEDHIDRWKKALAKVAGLAGYDSQNWSDEAEAIELISTDVSKKLLLTPLDDFRDFVGIEAHVKTIMDSKLCLDSGGVRMVGIWGPSGIGKTTIATALFNRLSSTQFGHRAFLTYKRAMQDKKIADVRMKLDWANHFLSEILGQRDIKIKSLGQVEQSLKHSKVLVVLDDVDEIELLEALVGKAEWFGLGSRIIVVTQDKALLESHGIDVIYEVELPSEDLALQFFCQSAFGKTSPPDGFKELAVEVAKLAGHLPLGLNALGSSLRKKRKEHWVDMMPRLRSGLDGKIKNTLRLCYDGLDEKDDQDIFVYIACLFNGESVNHIKNLLHDSLYPSVSASLTTLADKSLIRKIGPCHIVQMHILLQKLGREIVREESIPNPGKRRFLVDPKDIFHVFNDNTGTKNVLGIHLDTSEIYKPLFIDEKAFEGMRNLQFIKFYKSWSTGEVRLSSPQGLVYLPHKLRLLHWDYYPAKYLPSSFSAEYLVEIRMENSKLEKLWEGTNQAHRSLKVISLPQSKDLKEIPDLSNATNLEILDLCHCPSLVTLPSPVRNLKKLSNLWMCGCTNLEVLPTDVNLESLGVLTLDACYRLRTFPQLSTSIEVLNLSNTAIEEVPSWIENIAGLTQLWMAECTSLEVLPTNINLVSLSKLHLSGCSRLRTFPQLSTSIKELHLSNTAIEEVPSWIENMERLSRLEMSGCEKLKKISATIWNLKHLELVDFTDCGGITSISDESLVRTVAELHAESIENYNEELPSRVSNCLNLNLKGCTSLEILPTNINLVSLTSLDLTICPRLKTFPQLSTSIKELNLSNTAIEEVPSWIENIVGLTELLMEGCTNLEVLPTNINLVSLTSLDLSGCSRLRTFPQLSTSIKELDLSSTAIEEVPSWIENIVGLTELLMVGCTNLEVLPTNINLVSLTTLDLSGCSRLASFPQFSTSIRFLYLCDTAIEEVPSWIENIIDLTYLGMTHCEKLKIISANIWNLKHLDFVDFTDCGGVTSVSDTSLVKTVAGLHAESIANHPMDLYPSCSCSHTEFLFHNCFNLDQDAQKFILRSDSRFAVLPGKEVPTYFTHRTRGSSLTVPLPQSSLSQNHLRFTACIILDRATIDYCPKTIIVHWKFRGVTGNIYPSIYPCEMDQLGVFHFDFCPREEVNDPPSQLDCNSVQFEFEFHSSRPCHCYNVLGTKDRNLQTCPNFPYKVKECGVRALNVSPAQDANDISSRESDEESEGSKKRMRMTVETSGENSNSLSGQTAVKSGSMSLNLELSLGLVGAPPHVSSRSKVPSPFNFFNNITESFPFSF